MIAIYVRVSTEGQRDQFSLPIQKANGIKFASTQNEEYQIYEDVLTGTNLSRQGWESLKEDILKGRINSLWVKTQDRLSRSTMDALQILEILRSNNTKLFVDGTPQNYNDPNSIFSYTILSAVAEIEASKIKERSLSGKHKEIDSGLRRYSSLYGYDFSYNNDGTKQWNINKEEAETVKYIFKMATEEKQPLTKITSRLNKEGHKPKKARYFEKSAVSRILKHLEYTGRTYNTHREIIESKVYEPIIEIQTWEKAQNIYETCITPNSRRGRKATHPATNIIKCSNCGQGYYFHKGVRTKKKDGVILEKKDRLNYAHKLDYRYTKKKCPQKPKYLDYELMNYFVLSLYAQAMADKKNIIYLMEDINDDQKKTNPEREIERLETQKSKIEEKIKNLSEALEKGADFDTIIPLFNDNVQEKKNLDQQIELNREKLSQREMKKNHLLAEFAISNISDYINSTSGQEKRNMLQHIIESCTIDQGIITTVLKSGVRYEHSIKELESRYKSKYSDMSYLNSIKNSNPKKREVAFQNMVTNYLSQLDPSFNSKEYYHEYFKKVALPKAKPKDSGDIRIIAVRYDEELVLVYIQNYDCCPIKLSGWTLSIDNVSLYNFPDSLILKTGQKYKVDINYSGYTNQTNIVLKDQYQKVIFDYYK